MNESEMVSYIMDALDTMDPDPGQPRVGWQERTGDNGLRVSVNDGGDFIVRVERA